MRLSALAVLTLALFGCQKQEPSPFAYEAGDVPAASTAQPPDGGQPTPAGAATSSAPATKSYPGAPLPENCQIHTTASGLQYAVLAAGDSVASCAAEDRVTVKYAGFLEDGRRFDGTPAGQTAMFACNQVITGWQEGLQLMTPGSKYKFIIPWQLAYGEEGYPGLIPPKSNLIFDVELVSVAPAPKPMSVPPFVLPDAADLNTTDSGLQWLAVSEGSGSFRPGPTSQVTVHYAGWLTDGTLFDSSYGRGEPMSFPLNRVIAGWTEGLQLMSTGATYLFVIPSELAYGPAGAGGVIGPDATLVFRVELLSVDS